jgi:hypothetical protein
VRYDSFVASIHKTSPVRSDFGEPQVKLMVCLPCRWSPGPGLLSTISSIVHGRTSEKIKRRILHQRRKKTILLQRQVDSVYPAISFSMLSSMFF